MSTITGSYEKFRERFGVEQTQNVVAAAESHKDQIYENFVGSDYFVWCLVMCITFDCFKEKYRAHHGITLDEKDVKSFILHHKLLDGYDGRFDALSLLAGSYDEYISTHIHRQK